MRRVVLLLIMAGLLAACGGQAQVLPTSVPVEAGPVSANEPTAQVAVDNRVEVPGKLLLVNNANLVIVSGEKTVQLTSSGKKYQPTWSPDGTRLAYIQREESFADLWVMSADGSDKVQITNNEPQGIEARSETHVTSIKWAFYPAWSPDGSLLTYVSQAKPPTYVIAGSEVPIEYPLSLYLYGSRRIGDGNFAGPSFQHLLKLGTDLTHPTWGADNSFIVYTQTERDTDAPQTLGFFDYASGTSGVLSGQTAEQFANTLDPDFSADGSWLAYIQNADTNSDIWVVPAPASDGSVAGTPQQLTTGRHIRAPTWSPDGKHIAFFEARNNTIVLYMADVATSGAGKLSLTNEQEIWQGNFDTDSGMSWVK